MRVTWIVAAGALLLAGPAAADVYRCEDASGRTVFSDAPCDGEAEPYMEAPDRRQRSGNRQHSGGDSRPSAAGTPIAEICEREWSDDYRMQRYCRDRHIDAVRNLNRKRKRGFTDVEERIVNRCMDKWSVPGIEDGYNWQMVEYCYNQQTKAYDSLD